MRDKGQFPFILYYNLLMNLRNTSAQTQHEQHPSEKVIATPEFSSIWYIELLLTYNLGNNQDEATHHQELLEANRMERVRCTECKHNKANGIDRPAQSDDEERLTAWYFFFYWMHLFLSDFSQFSLSQSQLPREQL